MNTTQINDLLLTQEMAYSTMIKHVAAPDGLEMAIHLQEHFARMQNILYEKYPLDFKSAKRVGHPLQVDPRNLRARHTRGLSMAPKPQLLASSSTADSPITAKGRSSRAASGPAASGMFAKVSAYAVSEPVDIKGKGKIKGIAQVPYSSSSSEAGEDESDNEVVTPKRKRGIANTSSRRRRLTANDFDFDVPGSEVEVMSPSQKKEFDTGGFVDEGSDQ